MFIGLNQSFIILDYFLAIAVSIIIALALRLPLLPNKPRRYSFELSAIYPTPLIAIGLLSIFFYLNYYFIYNGIVLSIIIAIFAAIFVKYIFKYVFPTHNGEGF